MTTYQFHLHTVSGMKTFLTMDFPNFLMFDLKGTATDDNLTTPAYNGYLVTAGAGSDVVHIEDVAKAGFNGVIAGAGEDHIFGASGSDYVLAGSGADYVYVAGGENRAFGQRGDDFVFGGSGDDRLDGGDGDDKLFGNRGDDMLLGGHGRDFLRGGAGTNLLRGGSGNDSYMLFGNDTVIDSDGRDIYAVSLGAHVTISDTGGMLDVIEIGQEIQTLTLSRQGDDLLISGLQDGGSVDVAQFFVPKHDLNWLMTSDGRHQLLDIHDLKAGESVNGGDVWGFVSL